MEIKEAARPEKVEESRSKPPPFFRVQPPQVVCEWSKGPEKFIKVRIKEMSLGHQGHRVESGLKCGYWMLGVPFAKPYTPQKVICDAKLMHIAFLWSI